MDTAGLPERLAARLARGRAASEARMLSRVVVMRKIGLLEQDPDTGREDATWATVHLDLPFRLDLTGTGQMGGADTDNIADARVAKTVALGRVPHDTADLADGDLVVITTGEWPDTVWRIPDATSGGDQQTDRRFEVEQAQRPTEWGA